MSANQQRNPFSAHSIKRLVSAGFLSALLAVQMLTGIASAQPSPNTNNPPTDPAKLAPLLNEQSQSRIPDQYIVVFKPGTSREVVLAAQRRVQETGGKISNVYRSAIIGFSAVLPKSALEAMRAEPGVAYIEADQKGSFDTIQPPNPPGNPPTGLDRIDRRLLPLNGTYTYSELGTGVNAYVIDSGMRITHMEFGGRAVNAFTVVPGDFTDCINHGTHVAGTIGGATFGIAKNVALHNVRVGDAGCVPTAAAVIAGVDWVTANRVLPAVANLSLTVGNSVATDTAVINSIASGVTYTIAAGNANADACNASPARVLAAITVGSVDPANDTRAGTSNFGTCLDLFAPGVSILSSSRVNDSATAILSGTSMAAPHVAGVAARYLQTHPMDTPANVWNAIHLANNTAATMGWGGIVNPGAGSPNELLHYGSLNDGVNDGDPHITTVNGIHYDFQNGGEFVSLRDGNGTEIQTRQTPVPSAPWVSVNTAVAARVGAHRVTWQPNISGVPDPSGLQLRVDGALTTLGAAGLDLGAGGRVVKLGGNGIEINFPDGTALIATANWWASQSQWYIDVHVYHTPATEGLMGVVEPDSWLQPQFAAKWSVTRTSSLFDYAYNVTTDNFTQPVFPKEKIPPLKPRNLKLAKAVCVPIIDKNARKNCIFDVAVTGDRIFARSYLVTQKIQRGATRVTVNDDGDPSRPGERVSFIATVTRQAAGQDIPTGTVQFMLDGKETGAIVKLDSKGQALWKASLRVGEHRVAAKYYPGRGSVYLPSSSLDERHTVEDRACPGASAKGY